MSLSPRYSYRRHGSAAARHGPVTWQFPPIENPGYRYLWFTGVIGGQPMVFGLIYGEQITLFVPSLLLDCLDRRAPTGDLFATAIAGHCDVDGAAGETAA